jgi:DNA-binding CsgD family transcriptional regulator
MRPARIPIAQHSRNPSPRDREILTLLAEGHTQKDAARILAAKPRTITAAVERMRDRYSAPTDTALAALAVSPRMDQPRYRLQRGHPGHRPQIAVPAHVETRAASAGL